MKGETRKAAINAYKERKIIGGIYVVRCEATGEAWVGQWPNIETIQTRQWFTLKHGSHPNKNLQACWNEQGEAGIQFEILEKLDEETSNYLLVSQLKERANYWRAKLGAQIL